MEKQGGKGDGSDIGDCSDNDLNKGSDDVVNFVKSSNHMSNIQLVMAHKINYICFGTMVSVISIVVTVVMLVVISNGKSVFYNMCACVNFIFIHIFWFSTFHTC